ncbi:response regulator [Brachybacterium muris]|uniref:LuxR family transcriptional regulator n=1 Tax=Brachybacterium muris UCD-AY4 TaxID=1249481 RepID=A0A022KV50_9MICO|nr:response regulator transcription factor [Brachybacterium muris]EYT47754.1 LuxR family transcriptional regulator [Brachybacterium muris UCD-AY4]
MTAPAPIRVVVADDHPAVLAGLVALLSSAPDVEVVGQASDGESAVRTAQVLRPDVVLTDVRMPGATGIEITPRLRETGANVLVISGFDLDEFVLGALSAGADGYLVKTEDPDRILQAVRDVHRGDSVLSVAATKAVVAALRGGGHTAGIPQAEEPEAAGARAGGAVRVACAGSSAHVPSLTRREEDVLALVAQGLSNQQIASELFVEITTVKTHLSHALAKLQLDSRVQAALWWQQNRASPQPLNPGQPLNQGPPLNQDKPLTQGQQLSPGQRPSGQRR